MQTGDLIRQARKKAGLTQKALSERCGIAEPTIRKYESGKLNPKQATLQKLAQALGVNWYDLDGNSSGYLLDEDVAKTFRARADFVLSTADVEDIILTFGTPKPYESILSGATRPTASDVSNFSDSTGVSEAFLLGLTDDETEAMLKPHSGFETVDVGLLAIKVKKLVSKDLHQECTEEDAAMIVELLLDVIQPQNIVPFAKRLYNASPEIRKAAMAVLQSEK